MTTMDSSSERGERPRRPGAPKGNRNAWKHGERSAAAKAAREADRARIIDRLPDARLFAGIAERSEVELKHLGWNVPLAGGQSDKPDVSVARPKEGEGGSPSIFSEIKTNNSIAEEPARRRGAPKDNRNALKHGYNSGKRREFDSSLRDCLRRLKATCKLAHAMANAGRLP